MAGKIDPCLSLEEIYAISKGRKQNETTQKVPNARSSKFDRWNHDDNSDDEDTGDITEMSSETAESRQGTLSSIANSYNSKARTKWDVSVNNEKRSAAQLKNIIGKKEGGKALYRTERIPYSSSIDSPKSYKEVDFEFNDEQKEFITNFKTKDIESFAKKYDFIEPNGLITKSVLKLCNSSDAIWLNNMDIDDDGSVSTYDLTEEQENELLRDDDDDDIANKEILIRQVPGTSNMVHNENKLDGFVGKDNLENSSSSKMINKGKRNGGIMTVNRDHNLYERGNGITTKRRANNELVLEDAKKIRGLSVIKTGTCLERGKFTIYHGDDGSARIESNPGDIQMALNNQNNIQINMNWESLQKEFEKFMKEKQKLMHPSYKSDSVEVDNDVNLRSNSSSGLTSDFKQMNVALMDPNPVALTAPKPIPEYDEYEPVRFNRKKNKSNSTIWDNVAKTQPLFPSKPKTNYNNRFTSSGYYR